jgi:hypothetical protein
VTCRAQASTPAPARGAVTMPEHQWRSQPGRRVSPGVARAVDLSRPADGAPSTGRGRNRRTPDSARRSMPCPTWRTAASAVLCDRHRGRTHGRGRRQVVGARSPSPASCAAPPPLALPLDLGAPFGGSTVVGGVVAPGLWLFLLHLVVVLGWLLTQSLDDRPALRPRPPAGQAARDGGDRNDHVAVAQAADRHSRGPGVTSPGACQTAEAATGRCRRVRPAARRGHRRAGRLPRGPAHHPGRSGHRTAAGPRRGRRPRPWERAAAPAAHRQWLVPRRDVIPRGHPFV